MRTGLGERGRLIGLIALLLFVGFAGTSVLSFVASRQALRASIIENELPVTSDTVYSEIQRDLIRPIFISSMIASDTFLRDWILAGERTPADITKYLGEVSRKYDAFTSFLVSDRSSVYYQSAGILKKVSEGDARDAWYFRVKGMTAPYEINVDPDLAHADALTVFINFRVLDYDGAFLGAAGVGINVAALGSMAAGYQEKYGRSVYFVDKTGMIVAGSPGGMEAGSRDRRIASIHDMPGLRDLASKGLSVDRGSFQYERDGKKWLLDARVVDEIGWHLFVEKDEDAATAGIRAALLVSLAVWGAITLLILALSAITINRFQARLEKTASVDGMTGFFNRRALGVLVEQAFKDMRRVAQPLSLIMVDLDLFKAVNDSYGHHAGDLVLTRSSAALRSCLRESDLASRWGGEEFLLVLRSCALPEALLIAEKMRAAVASADSGGPRITASFGVAERKPDEDFDSLLRRADAALYRAKEDGRDRVNQA